jgi:hypothetical protein
MRGHHQIKKYANSNHQQEHEHHATYGALGPGHSLRLGPHRLEFCHKCDGIIRALLNRVKCLVPKMAPVAVGMLLWCAAAPSATHSDSLGHRLVNKQAVARTAAGATWGQLRNSPHEWGKGPLGFGKRLASGFGRHIINTTIQAGVGAIHHENLHYQRSNLHGTFPRLKYAVVSTFWVPRTNRNGHTVALARISGQMGAGLISRAWQPASTAGLGAGIASGGIGLAGDVGIHVAKEFWPRHGMRASAQ